MLERISASALLASGWQRHLLSLAAGALSALAMPPLDIFPVMFLSFPALVWILDGVHGDAVHGFPGRLAAGFLPGWWFGFGFFTAGLWWIGGALLVDAGSFAWALPLAILVLPALLAVFWGMATLAASFLWSDSAIRIAALAACVSVSEYLRGTVLTGFPWNTIGYAAMPTPLAMQTASVIGLYGVTLLSVVAFSGPLVALGTPATGRRGSHFLMAVSLTIIAGHAGFGWWRLAANPVNHAAGPVVRIMQPSVPQTLKSDPAAEGETVESYFTLSASKSLQGREGLSGIDYLVWPESAFPFLLTERRDVLARIGAMLPEGTSLLTGATRAEPGISGNPYGYVYNSVYLIDSNGEIEGAADKVHLVPFGEYLPFQEVMERFGLQQLAGQRGGFDAGAQRTVLRHQGAQILPLICYEIIFPGQILTAQMGDGERPDWLLNVTNDAWYGRTPGPYQHFRQARIRAVEEGIALVRAANNGISAMTDPYGRVIASLGLDERGVIDGTVPPALSGTPFSTYGHIPFMVLAGLFALAALFRSRFDTRGPARP